VLLHKYCLCDTAPESAGLCPTDASLPHWYSRLRSVSPSPIGAQNWLIGIMIGLILTSPTNKVEQPHSLVRSSAAATMGLAHAGVAVRSDGPTMRPRCMCNTKTGMGACPVAGSAVAELS
jgi:hypothetical protein